MTRRDLFKHTILLPLLASFKGKKALWNPHPAQAAFLNLDLSGIPYHQSNGSTGTWLGFERSSVSEFKSTLQKNCANIMKIEMEKALEKMRRDRDDIFFGSL